MCRMEVKCIHPTLKTKELEIVPQVIWKEPGTVPWGMPQVRYWLSERSQPFHSLSLNFMIIVLKSMISQLELVSVCYVFLHLHYYKIKNIYFTNRLHAFGVCTPYWSLHIHVIGQKMSLLILESNVNMVCRQ